MILEIILDILIMISTSYFRSFVRAAPPFPLEIGRKSRKSAKIAGNPLKSKTTINKRENAYKSKQNAEFIQITD